MKQVKYISKYIKNILFYIKNYRKILDTYEDKTSKKYIKEYIKNKLISPLYYCKILNCDKSELDKIRKLVKFIGDTEFIIDNLRFGFPKSYTSTKYNIVLPEVFLYHYGLKYLESDILNIIRKGNIIDCGASFGDSSIILSKYTDHKVYALEPDKTIFNYLTENIRKNNLDNKIIPINCGVGDREEVVDFKTAKLNLTTIDNIVKNKNINKVSLIKMDVEGYELKALKGAKETIKKHKPILIVSAYHKREDILKIPNYLKKLNPEYKFKFLNLRKSHPIFEKVIVAYKL